MNRLVRLWKEQYGVSSPLEADSWARSLWNRWVVARLMGAFPNATKSILSRSRGELARLLVSEGEGGSFRALRAMYEYQDLQRRGDFINRLIMQSPGIKAIRNRRTIAQWMLEVCLNVQPPDSPALVLAVGGGDGSLELEVIARAAKRDVYYCGVDKDERATAEHQRVLQTFGLQGRGFLISGAAAEDCDLAAVVETARRRFDVPFDGAAVTVCHGLTEYLDVGRHTNEALARFLAELHRSTGSEGTLLISQSNHRNQTKFLERGLSWHVRLRSEEEMGAEMVRAGWQISVCQQEPMRLITMYLAVKSDGQRLRIDRREQLRRHRVPAPTLAPVHRRAAS
ncbi:MAG: class I SAM-dependent methyltransferase family protein [Pirellulales bacterium]|nr:class I SAM-dependent methyltransferase family protein [Pirellulales bacterium]